MLCEVGQYGADRGGSSMLATIRTEPPQWMQVA